jgi:hypothetical protein
VSIKLKHVVKEVWAIALFVLLMKDDSLKNHTLYINCNNETQFICMPSAHL